ncbi:MAG: galactitol-1-phosphate 5-dehydrogenase [Victivallales bacterium]|nr:galactitol-1-phosphate 5-dehydrogenase [Victivallales bacterium]
MMKALVMNRYGDLSVEDVPCPGVGRDEVLIGVKACGVCGSDVHGMDGSTGRRRPPIIMGHEASGEIVETGADVVKWRKGERVTFDSTIYCGRCWFCVRGRTNLCENRRVFGVSCGEYRLDGAFAEYVVAPQHILYSLPEALSFESATMVEALSVAFHAVNRAGLGLGDSVAVFGSGMIGLLVAQSARLAGCGKLLVVDIDDGKLEMSRAMGADHVFNAGKVDVEGEIRKVTGGRGADIVFEVVGVADTVMASLSSVRKGGRVILVGNLSPSIEFPLQSAVTREVDVLGSCASSGEYQACIDALASGKIDVEPLISVVAPLEEGNSFFHRLKAGEPGLMKVVLTPS